VQLMDTLLVEAEQARELHNVFVRLLVPWRAWAAIKLTHDLSLVEELRFDDDASSDDVQAVTGRIRSSARSEILKIDVDDTMLRGSHASDDVHQAFRALQRDVRLKAGAAARSPVP